MKITKLDVLFIFALILILSLLTGLGWNGWIKEASRTETRPETVVEKISGTSEFYYKPAGDDRTWHVVENYKMPGENSQNDHNSSSYHFTSDSVTVVSDIIIVPEDKLPEAGISALISKRD